MTVLAFDLASCTGWAVARPPYLLAPTPLERAIAGGAPPERTYSHKIIKNDGNFGRFLLSWEIWFRAMLEEHKPTIVAFEQPVSYGNRADHTLHALAAVLQLIAYRRKVTWTAKYTVREIKLHATGNGAATKNQMVDAAAAVGWRTTVDDEADALWLLDLTIAKLTPEQKGYAHVLGSPSAAELRTNQAR